MFGSMTVGLDRSDSDIDVLCIADRDWKFKTDLLDVIVLSQHTAESALWRGAELASHVNRYGVWLKGSCEAFAPVKVAERAIEEKRRRIAAFMRSLPYSWAGLEQGFRVKYSIKVRRELQRLVLLENSIPVPPTRVLDGCAADAAERYALCERLAQFMHGAETRGFRKEFFKNLHAHWRTAERLPER